MVFALTSHHELSRKGVIVAVRHSSRPTHKVHHKKPAQLVKRPPKRPENVEEVQTADDEPEHLDRLHKALLDLKSWLYAWTETGYEPL